MAKSLQKNNQTNPLIIFLIILIIILIWLIIYINQDKFFLNKDTNSNQTTYNQITTEELNNTWEQNNYKQKYFIWQKVELTWEIIWQWDLYNYTHIFVDKQWDQFGIKSSSIDLNTLSWTIKISGIIDDYKDNMYIVEVNSVLINNNSTQSSWNEQKQINFDNNQKENITFVKDAWLYIHDISWTNLKVNIDPLNQIILIKSTDNDNNSTWNFLEISYFKCSNESNDTNCNYILDTMKNISSVDFSTNDGQQFYSLPDVDWRFWTVDWRFWYYVKSNDKLFMINAMQHVQFLSDNFLLQLFNQTANKLCISWNIQLYTVDNMSLNQDLEATLTWKDLMNNTVVCKIKVNPEYILWWTLINVKKIEKNENINNNTWTDTNDSKENTNEENTTQNNAENNNSFLQKDENVKQFPINTDNPFEFKSRQGYTIAFPSKNIRFQADNVKTDLDTKWLYCYVRINVTKYTNDQELNSELVEKAPTVSIYVCNQNKQLEEQLKNKFFVNYIEWNDKIMFLVKPINPARFDFAKNIKFY